MFLKLAVQAELLSCVPCAGNLQSNSKRQHIRTESHQHLLRGASEKGSAWSLSVAAMKQANLQGFDKQLKQFQFRDALDTSLEMGSPLIVSNLLEELACRNALDSALGAQIALACHSWRCSDGRMP